MYPPGGSRQPEVDFEQIIAGLRTNFAKITERLGGGGVGLAVVLVIGLIAVIWAASGIYTISPGEQAALRLFGAAQQPPVDETGLHWWWPGPVGKKDVFLVNQVRRMELGFRSGEGVADASVPDEALMISGDLNIVDVRMVVQYDIANLTDFLFRVDDPGEPDRNIPPGQPDGLTLKDASESALRLVVGQRSIGDVLAEKRLQIETDTKDRLQALLDSYNTGLNVISVALQNVQAPEEVRAAFNDVLQARQDKVTAVNQAQAYENQVEPEARGQAQQIIQPAEAFKEARIARARGEAERFTSVLTEYRNSKDVTRQRLYLEAMEDILPGISKIIVSPDAESVLILGGGGGGTSRLIPVPVGPSPQP
ncbi:MAG: HflK protein [SAR202 cluster bacterium Io17-Chloro-G9]|nr:MAG: HflK protein [SAR202 cluster bacterium Io17-Chloro-G9]